MFPWRIPTRGVRIKQVPIQILAIDIDGTLLNSQWELPAANSQALAQAASRGVEIALFTGRRLHTARPIAAKLPCPATLIVSNGALISTPDGQMAYRNLLPRSAALEVLRHTIEHRGYTVTIFEKEGRGQVVMEQDSALDGPLPGYQQRYPEQLELVDSLERSLDTDPIQVTFTGPVQKIKRVSKTLSCCPARHQIHISITDYSERNLILVDIMNRGCNKGEALAFWTACRGMSPADVMAIGDNLNDYEMLQFAGLPVVMGNSVLDLTKNGWAMTRRNNEDGVAAAIQKYILN